MDLVSRADTHPTTSKVVCVHAVTVVRYLYRIVIYSNLHSRCVRVETVLHQLGKGNVLAPHQSLSEFAKQFRVHCEIDGLQFRHPALSGFGLTSGALWKIVANSSRAE